MSWRYVLSAIIGGITLLAFHIADKTLLSEVPLPIQPLIQNLMPATLYNSLYLAVFAIPVSFSFILVGRLFCIRSVLYYIIAGAVSGYAALWILAELFDAKNISLDPDSSQVLTAVSGGVMAGLFYRTLIKK